MTSKPSLFHRPLHVALLGGGRSAERAVSLDSAATVRAALEEVGHTVTPIDPAADRLVDVDWSPFDVAFLALHGTEGEDGQVQSLLECVRVPYTGSAPRESALAFSKSSAKTRFRRERVPTPHWKVLHEGDHASTIHLAAEAVGYPLVVKPDGQGSSLGVTIVEQPEQLSRALSNCFRFGSLGLIEAYVPGTEWTVGVLDDMSLPLVRIDAGRGFYDYAAKYERGDTRYELDVDLPTETQLAIFHAGVAPCRAVGTTGIARADVRLDEQGRPWVLEVNTIPGFTSHTLVPKPAARAGIEFAELCERALASALSRDMPGSADVLDRPAA